MYKFQRITNENQAIDEVLTIGKLGGDEAERMAMEIVAFARRNFNNYQCSNHNYTEDDWYLDFYESTKNFLVPLLGVGWARYSEIEARYEKQLGTVPAMVQRIFGDDIVHCSTSDYEFEKLHCSTSHFAKSAEGQVESSQEIAGKDVLQCSTPDVLQLSMIRKMKEEEERNVMNYSTHMPPLGSTCGTASGLTTQTKKKDTSPNALSGVDASRSTFRHLNTRGDTSRFNIDEIRVQIWYNGKKERVAEYSGKISHITHATKTQKETCHDHFFDFTNQVKYRRNLNQARLKKDRGTKNGPIPRGKRIVDNDWFVEMNDYLLEQNGNRKKYGVDETLVSIAQKREMKNNRVMWVHRQCQPGSEEVAVLYKGAKGGLDVNCVELFYGTYKITFDDFTINQSSDGGSASLEKRWYKRDNRAETEENTQENQTVRKLKLAG